jgi:hypothetical protein
VLISACPKMGDARVKASSPEEVNWRNRHILFVPRNCFEFCQMESGLEPTQASFQCAPVLRIA